jgi:hypothetical protein
MKAPGLLFLALYEKVPSLEGADVVTDIKIMTGCIFAQACNHFDIDFTKIHSPTDLATMFNFRNR